MDKPHVPQTALVYFYAKWTSGHYRDEGQRFGQAFCNAFNITDSELYYEEDENTAGEKMKKYLPTGDR